jgi:hypothetical protein
VLECWSAGVLECWSAGVLEFRDEKKRLEVKHDLRAIRLEFLQLLNSCPVSDVQSFADRNRRRNEFREMLEVPEITCDFLRV